MKKLLSTPVIADTAWLRLAKRYLWWQTPTESMLRPHRVMAQVMNLGTLQDVTILRGLTDKETLRQVLANASVGEFSDRSWHFWHQMLGDEDLVEVPALPQQRFA